MKISVLIAAYQAAATLPRALASVRAQTHANWEIVVVEDGSHDGTEELVQTFAATESHPARYENLGTNRGVATARNRLLQLATGEAMAFLDADDWWDAQHLERGAFHLRTGAGLVATGVQTFDLVTAQVLGEVLPPPALGILPVPVLFAASAIVTSSSVLLARRTVLATGEFDPAFRVGEDRDYWLRAALAGVSFQVEPAFTCHYAKHAGSSMAATRQVAEQTVRFYEKYLDLAVISRPARRHALAHALCNAARLDRARDARGSIHQLWRAWCLTPGDLPILLHLFFSGTRLFRSAP